MSAAKGFFDREVKIHNEAQMLEILKERSRAVGQSPKLSWNKPVSNKDGTGHQTAMGAPYELRKTLTKGVPFYWAWYERKLLGYSADVEIARTHCDAHALGSGT